MCREGEVGRIVGKETGKLKKAVVLTLALVLVLGSVGLVGCGGGGGGSEGGDGGASGGLSWSDMPVYSGANQVAKGSWSLPASEGDWATAEWRYYETTDSVEGVVAYYKSQMTGNGWQGQSWMDIEMPQKMSWGFYTKNSEQDGAMVWVYRDNEEGKTVIALMRSVK
jgi:hypothetical protein